MAKKKNKKGQAVEESFEQIEETLSRTEQFVEANSKTIMYVIFGVVGLVALVYAFNKLYREPLEEEAQKSIFVAQEYFALDSFRLALEGGAHFDGFEEVAEEYSSTKAGNLSNYYAGVCHKNLGNYNDAIEYLLDFDSNDFHLSSISISSIADCYFELEDYIKAADYYKKASEVNPNKYSTPIYFLRAGLAYEKEKEYEKALEMYEKLEKNFPYSVEGRDIQRYITRAKMHLK